MTETLLTPTESLLYVLGELVDARQRVSTLVEAKDPALVAWWRDSGLPKRQVGPALRRMLTEQGWPPEVLEVAGVSDATVRSILERVRSSA